MAKDAPTMTSQQRYAYAVGKMEMLKKQYDTWKRLKTIVDDHISFCQEENR